VNTRTLSANCAVVTAGVGFLVLCLNAAQFRMSLQLPSPWTSLGFLLTGMAIWFRVRSGRTSALLPLMTAFLILALGLATWSEYLLNVDYGIDKLLFANQLPVSAPHPGRPGTVTSFNFMLVGMALLLSVGRTRISRLACELCLVMSMTFCLLAFAVTTLGSGSGMAMGEVMVPSVSFLFVVCSVGVLTSNPKSQLLSLLRDPGPGGTFARWLMPVPLILPVLTVLTRTAGHHFGLFNSSASNAVFSFVDIFLAIVIVWGSSTQVSRVDRLRRHAEDDLRASRDELDERVNLRTQELLNANRLLEIQNAERMKAEREVRQANAMLNRVIEAAPLGICAFNNDGTVRKRNAVGANMGIAEERIFLHVFERAIAGERIAGQEIALPAETGQPTCFSVWASPLISAEGDIDGVVMMAVDTSERKAFEARVLQAQKLESIGVLAGGIAHDFNNILTGIMGNASLLLESFSLHHPDRSLVEQIILSSNRVGGLTRQLLAYAGKGRFVVEKIDISRLVEQTSELISTSIPKTVRLRLQLSENLPAIMADASQIQQIVMNLVINGAEAISGAGSVVVKTRMLNIDSQYLKECAGVAHLQPGMYVALEVTDSGCGMDHDTIAKIFDPFFTTKFTGRGLGLAAVQGIVRSHNGGLRVSSTPGYGTTFQIFFPPAVRMETSQPGTSFTEAKVARGSGTILVIDDEPTVRETAASALRWMGYEVILAASGDEGLASLKTRAADVNAVVLDLTMLGLSGTETFKLLRGINPELPIIVSSGFNETEAVGILRTCRLASFLQKPYTVHHLAQKIESALGRDAVNRNNIAAVALSQAAL
jgi:signal transduction histidine kinase/ActR/RegA family two-component response regulator